MAKRKNTCPHNARDVHYNLYKKIALYFFITSIILFSFVFYFVFRQAVVHVTPNYEVININFIADVKENPREEEIAGRILQISLDDSYVYPVESEIEENKENITGNIRIINKSNKAQALVATTRFLTADQKLLRLGGYAIIPADGEITSEIYADNPKEITEEIIPQNLVIPGLSKILQEKIFGILEEPIKPNTGNVKILRDADIAKAKEIITENLFKKAIVTFAKEIKSDEKILPKAISREEINFETDKKIDEKTEFVKVKMKAIFTAAVFKDDDLFLLAGRRLKENIGEGRKVSGLDKENLIYELEKYDLKSNTANLKVMLSGKVSIDKNNKILDKEKIVGLTKSDAALVLKNNPEIKDIKIVSIPAWLERLPRIKTGIVFVMEE